MNPSVRFLRDDQNPRWDDRQLHRWLDREIRFDAAFESVRVVCRVALRDFVHAFGPVPEEEVFGVVDRYRLAIDAAAQEKIYQRAYASDIHWGDPNTVSILLTCFDIERAIAARNAPALSDIAVAEQ
jgi:hypothetical protein